MRKWKTLTAVGLAVVVIVSMAVGCAKPAPTPEKGWYSQPEFILRGGNAATDKTAHNIATQMWGARIYERSRGRIKIENYPFSKLGGQDTMEQMKAAGTLDFGMITLSAYDFLFPKAAIASIPFLIQTPYSDEAIEEGWQITNEGWLADIEVKALEDYGVFRYVHGGGGFYTCFFAAKHMRQPEDYKGAKIRVGLSPLWKEYVEKLGVIPCPIPWAEIYTGLQHGTFDGMFGNMEWPFEFKFHEVAGYVTLSPMSYAATEFTWSKKRWDSYPEDVQKLLLEERAQFEKDVNDLERQAFRDYIAKMPEQGVKFYSLTPEEIAVFTKVSAELISPYVEQVWGKDVLEKIKKEYWKIK